MSFQARINKIDSEIASAKERGRRIWADFDIPINGIQKELNKYYKEKGYMIEIKPCRGCGFLKADIFISW